MPGPQFALIAIFFSATSCVHSARILTYTVRALTVSESANVPWAQWDSSVVTSGTVSPVSTQDDAGLFDQIGYSMPYFQQSNLSWYISSNGFLSPSDAPLCSTFCSVSGTSPYQQTASSNSDANGAYPSIQLFAGDLNPNQAGAGDVYKRRYLKDVSGNGEVLQVAGVTYFKIPRYADDPRTLGSGDYLTAQVELWPNGTIIMRYEQRILFSFSPTIGLAWTPLQRVVLNQYTAAAAIRLSPVLDPCDPYSNCSSCMSAATCTWCGSLSMCVNNSVVDDYCAVSQRNTCAELNAPRSRRFYSIRQSTSVTQGADDFFGVVGQAIPSPTVYRAPYWANWTSPINLPASIGVFYNATWNASSPYVRSQVRLGDVGILSMLGTGQSCSTSGFCANGMYQYALLGVAGFNVFVSDTTIEVGQLPAGRTSPFCGTAAQINGSCPAALIIRVTDLSFGSYSPLQYSYVMLIDSTGRIAIRYLRGSVNDVTATAMPFVGYPVPAFGLIRDGVTDPSGAAIPWGSVTTGTTLVLTPQPTCLDCGSGGVCNTTSLQCVCNTNFRGQYCEECQPGYYGPKCKACPDCGSNGQCNDGIAAYGNCSCTAPYSGQYCERQCSSAPYTCTPGCSGAGGYCSCGTCVCNTNMGWHGSQCEQWSDPCFSRSLDGCPVCTASTQIVCKFCPSSFVCMADTSQDNIGTGPYNNCSAVKLSAGSATCVVSKQLTQTANTTAVVFVLLAFGAVGLVACLLFSCICACRRMRINVLAASAVTGTPDFKFPRREREVVQMVLVPIQGKRGKPVQGIPLKQVPMKVMYQQQQEKLKSARATTTSAHQIRDWNTTLSREE